MSYKVQRRRYRYFYLNGMLHKTLLVNRSRDELLAWCYSEHSRRIYQWSHVQKYGSRGFFIGQVAKMVNRTTRMIQYYMEWGLLEKPEMTYSLENGRPGKLIFSEEDVMKIQEIQTTMHIGRPRKDGFIVTKKNITKKELYARMKHDLVLYAKTDEGEFVPLYAAEEW